MRLLYSPLAPLALAACLLLPSAAAGQSVTAPAGFTPLFNGRDLTGWYGMEPDGPEAITALSEEQRAAKRAAETAEAFRHWSVEDSELVNDGKGPYLTTEQEFGDIELLIDFRIAPKGDSGVFLRGAPQVQIWDYTDEAIFSMGGNKGSGGLWNNSPGVAGQDPLVLADRPVGQWNTFRILQIGARTTIYLNDQLVVDHAIMENYWNRGRPLYRTGPIQLQTHGGEIRWRNVFVREIPADEANRILSERNDDGFVSVFNGCDLTGWTGAVDNYEVVDSAIRCRQGQGGTLHTEEEYADFVVRLELRVPEAGNNGLAIRYPGSGDAAYTGMAEIQVIDPGYPGELDPRQVHGSAYGMVAAVPGYLRPAGQWNFQEVTVEGSRIRVELNGTVILDADLADIDKFMADTAHPGKDLKSGFFGFAGHSDPVEFRHIRIRRLADRR